MFWARIKGDVIIAPGKVNQGVKLIIQKPSVSFLPTASCLGYDSLLSIIIYNAYTYKSLYTSNWLKNAGLKC